MVMHKNDLIKHENLSEISRPLFELEETLKEAEELIRK